MVSKKDIVLDTIRVIEERLAWLIKHRDWMAGVRDVERDRLMFEDLNLHIAEVDGSIQLFRESIAALQEHAATLD